MDSVAQPSLNVTPWKITSTGGSGGDTADVSVGDVGLTINRLWLEWNGDKDNDYIVDLVGAGYSVGPIPFGAAYSFASFPSWNSRVYARPGLNDLGYKDFAGGCWMMSASIMFGSPTPASAAIIFMGAEGPFHPGPDKYVLPPTKWFKCFGLTSGIDFGISEGVSSIWGHASSYQRRKKQ